MILYTIARALLLIAFAASTTLASVMFLDFLGHFGWTSLWDGIQLLCFVAVVLSAVGSFLALLWDMT